MSWELAEVREDCLIQDNPRSWLHRRYQMTNDVDGLVVRPVMQDPAKDIDFSRHRLIKEEVMNLKINSVFKIFWYSHGLDLLVKILDNKFQVEEFRSHADAQMAVATTDL